MGEGIKTVVRGGVSSVGDCFTPKSKGLAMTSADVEEEIRIV